MAAEEAEPALAGRGMDPVRMPSIRRGWPEIQVNRSVRVRLHGPARIEREGRRTRHEACRFDGVGGDGPASSGGQASRNVQTIAVFAVQRAAAAVPDADKRMNP